MCLGLVRCRLWTWLTSDQSPVYHLPVDAKLTRCVPFLSTSKTARVTLNILQINSLYNCIKSSSRLFNSKTFSHVGASEFLFLYIMLTDVRGFRSKIWISKASRICSSALLGLITFVKYMKVRPVKNFSVEQQVRVDLPLL